MTDIYHNLIVERIWMLSCKREVMIQSLADHADMYENIINDSKNLADGLGSVNKETN